MTNLLFYDTIILVRQPRLREMDYVLADEELDIVRHRLGARSICNGHCILLAGHNERWKP